MKTKITLNPVDSVKKGDVLVSVKDLEVKFTVREKTLTAIRHISMDIYKNETLAIVGESGSGKSVFTKCLTGMLEENGRISDGTIMYAGYDLSKITNNDAWLSVRGKRISTIFQDPMTSLNPLRRIGSQITEVIRNNGNILKNKYEDYVSNDYNAYIDAIENHKKVLSQLANKQKASIEDVKKLYTEEYKAELKKNYENTLLELSKNSDDESKKQIEDLKKQYSENTEESKISKIKEETSKEVKSENDEYAKNIVLLKQNLEQRKEEAKKINKDYVAENSKVRDGNLAKLKASLAKEKEAYKKAVKEIKAKYAKDHKELFSKYDGSNVEETYAKKHELKAQMKAAKKQAYGPVHEVEKEINNEKETYQRKLAITKKQAKEKAIYLLKRVGIKDAESRFRDFPFQYSGGMRQRVVIAIALACAPDILICDEPTTALDVTIQAQILDLITELKNEYGFTVIFITHDLGVVAEVADRVAVMYAGQIVEYGTVNDIYYDPKHPYTWSLLSSLPQLGEKGETLYSITGTPPSLFTKINGDAFAPRNPFALEIDYIKEPPMFKVSETHYAKTWLLDPRAPKIERPAIIGEITERVAKIYGGKD